MRSAAASPGLEPAPARADSGGLRGATVRIASLRKTYGDLEAIREMSFDVGDGEFLSVLGPSGCGKSTLLMMIAGLIAPTAGEIRVKDTKVAGPRRDVGVVFQSPVLLPWRTVLQNVLFPIELMRLPRPQYESRAMELLRMAKIDEFAGTAAASALGRHAPAGRDLPGARARSQHLADG